MSSRASLLPLADANYNFCIKKAITGFPGSEVTRTVSWTVVGNGKWVLKVTGMAIPQSAIMANGERATSSLQLHVLEDKGGWRAA